MKRIEQIIVILTVIGIIIKLLLMSGGDLLLGITLTLLATIYYPFGFFYFNSILISRIFKKESYKGITLIRGFGTIGGGIIFSILTVGIMFKLLQLPGAGVMLTTGLSIGTIFFVITILKYLKNRESLFHKKMILRTVIIISISGILHITPGLTLVKIFYRDNPKYIKAYEQAAMNPNDMNLQKKAEEAREKRNQ